VAEDDLVAGRFTCYGVNRGDFQRAPPPGKKQEETDEVYFLRVERCGSL
jgi:hypothetical protein